MGNLNTSSTIYDIPYLVNWFYCFGQFFARKMLKNWYHNVFG